jgi:lysophospholipase L1-like esterase
VLPPERAPFDPPRIAIEHPERLAPFYEALAELARGGSTRHVRIAVFGDSNLTMDFTTGRMRRALQLRFGDAGHGFVALGRPWSHYRHMDVEHGVVSGWRAYAITTSPTGDGLYGLGGIAVENQWQGAVTFVGTAKEGAPVGTSAERFFVYSLKRPRGGAFQVRLDGRRVARVDTDADAPKLEQTLIEAPAGPHRLDVIASSPSVVRVFGVALEAARPGIIVDSFGVGSLNTKTMAKNDPRLVKDMLAARRYDLLVHMTGANDVFTMDAVPEALKTILAAEREALPNAAILLVTPADRGFAKTFKPTVRVVAQRHELADREGVALWDQFAAMGGEGSMRRFVEAKLAYDDAVHFTEAGGAFMGDRLVDALLASFDAYLAVRPDAGCPMPRPITEL